MEVKFDRYSLIIDGKPKVIRSASIHYFRTPGAELWFDRLSKLRAAGYNAVDVYFCWNFHTNSTGDYSFEGIKDVDKFLETVERLGLYLIARPGPFINAEVSAGGLPFWLLKDKEVIPRNKKDGNYIYSEKYMQELSKWYDLIVPKIIRHENLIAFQIENEYSTNGGEADYIKELYKMAKDRGVNVPIFHNDAYIAGLYADEADIYAVDIYPFINPRVSWKNDTFTFDTLDNVEEISRLYKPQAPIYIAELQSGWYDKWHGKGYDDIRKNLGREHLNAVTKTALSQGVTMFNHYMGCGGTNFLDVASDEVYTCYDFAAPISEIGEIKENYYVAKEINSFLYGFNFAHTEPIDSDFVKSCENVYVKARRDLINNVTWLFLRNFNSTGVDINLTGGRVVKLKPYEMKIVPLELELYACKLDFSGAEIFTRLKNKFKETVFLICSEGNYIEITDKNGERTTITSTWEDFFALDFEFEGKKTKVVFISRECADKAWIFNGNLIFGADFIYPYGEIFLHETKNITFYNLDVGFFEREYKVEKKRPFKIAMKSWDVDFCAPEIEKSYDYSKWKKVEDDKLDIFSNGIYSEFIFYKGKISNKVREITLSALHLFAVYINGVEVLNRDSYLFDNMNSVGETVTFAVDYSLLTDDVNEITVLVQNLGFDRGFTNDMNKPRGMVTFETVPYEKINWHIRGRIGLESRKFDVKQEPYIAQLKTKFYLSEFKPYNPLILNLNEAPFERATIFLNGIKIGRFLKFNSRQTSFYLPQAFLANENELSILVWEKKINISSITPFKNKLENAIIVVEAPKSYTKF